MLLPDFWVAFILYSFTTPLFHHLFNTNWYLTVFVDTKKCISNLFRSMLHLCLHSTSKICDRASIRTCTLVYVGTAVAWKSCTPQPPNNCTHAKGDLHVVTASMWFADEEFLEPEVSYQLCPATSGGWIITTCIQKEKVEQLYPCLLDQGKDAIDLKS